MLIAIGSLKGSPGVSRLAMSLTAVWPGETKPTLIECDAAGGTLAARFGLAADPSLTSLAATTFRDASTAAIGQHTHDLPGGSPVIPAPADPVKVNAALADLSGPDGLLAEVAGERSGHWVIADCGRLDTRALNPVVGLADALVLVARPTPEETVLVGLGVEALRATGADVSLVLRGRGYGADELSRTLRAPTFSLPEVPQRGWRTRAQQAAYARAVLHLARELTRTAAPAAPAVAA